MNGIKPNRDHLGRFSHGSAAEVDLNDLGGPGADLYAPGSRFHAPDSVDVITAQPHDLDAYVHHPDPYVRADATANPGLTDEHVEVLADPHIQPEHVRHSLSLCPRPGVAARLANDPSPTVRLSASESWDYSDADRQRLRSDPAVSRLMSLLDIRRSTTRT